MNELKLLTDQALGEGNDPNLDGLGFTTYAQVLGKAALETPGPLTIGVFGEWGTGKTSLMRMIEHQLADREEVVTVWFNAWRYEKEEHPIIPLVATIIREMERKKSVLSKLKDIGPALIKSLRAVAYGFSAKSKIKVPGAEVEASFAAKDMIERSDALNQDPFLDHCLYHESFERLSAIPLSDKVRIVVMIDDLDRCFPDLAIRMLESIKLVLSQPGFVFILGVARTVIEGYLTHRYTKEYGLLNFKGESYLDKIVQVPFHIPSHGGRMKFFSDKILDRIGVEFKEKLKSVMPIVASASGNNPRATVRFVNNLMLDVAINREFAEAGEMNKIQIEYFAVTRCLQLRWSQTFSLLMNEDGLRKSLATWKEDDLPKKKGSKDTNEANLAETLIGDKVLQTLLLSPQGHSWLTDDSQRRETFEFLRTQRFESDDDTDKASKVYDVFITYSPKDGKIVADIADHLSRNGLHVFMDPTITDNWTQNAVFESSLKGSKSIAIFFSPNYLTSEWSTPDMTALLERISKGDEVRMVPVILPDTDITKIPIFLRKYFWLDLREGIEKPMLDKLLHTIRF